MTIIIRKVNLVICPILTPKDNVTSFPYIFCKKMILKSTFAQISKLITKIKCFENLFPATHYWNIEYVTKSVAIIRCVLALQIRSAFELNSTLYIQYKNVCAYNALFQGWGYVHILSLLASTSRGTCTYLGTCTYI